MNPLRLLILGGLFYLLYRLLFGQHKGPAAVGNAGKTGGDEAAIRDVLVADPVCGVYVPQGQAVSCRKEGQTFYFCSDNCCKIFLGGKDAAV